MANEGDIGNELADLRLQLALENQQKKAKTEAKLMPRGYCINENCGEVLRRKDQLFCNSSCAEEHDKSRRR